MSGTLSVGLGLKLVAAAFTAAARALGERGRKATGMGVGEWVGEDTWACIENLLAAAAAAQLQPAVPITPAATSLPNKTKQQ